MGLLRTEYKIEVWQDIWNGSYWDEERVVTIGANDMEYLGRAINPVLNMNVSGEVTFSFEMQTRYYNPDIEDYEDNYLIPYLFNEAKIKVYCPQYSTYESDGVTPINNGWFDFIIKQIGETRGKNISFVYTCQYLPINELSKTGQNLVFSLDLANGVGTIDEIETTILDGTDWSLGEINADLTEAVEETVFAITVPVGKSFSLTGIPTVAGTPVNTTASAGDTLYVCYNEIIDTESSTIQVIYIPGGIDDFILYSGNIISNKECYYTINRNAWDLVFDANDYVATKYRGYKIVTSYVTLWNNDVGHYVNKYDNPSDSITYYRYSVTEKKSTEVKFTDSTNLVTKSNHGYINGNIVSFSSITTTTGISSYTNYYVISATANTFQVSLTEGGAAIDLVSDGTGILVEEVVLESVPYYFYYDGSDLVELDNETDADLIALLEPVLISDSEKVRTLEAEDSNRFNLTQSVAELFEVWARFDIYHDIDGKITISSNKQVKKVSFVDEIGKNKWAGFTYGVNLTQIKRNVVSNNIATKMFVPGIENENLKDGTCSIAYVTENTSGQEWLINLDYYVQIGLIDYEKLIYDLYDIGSSTGIGYLTKLGTYNDMDYSSLVATLETEVSFAEEALYVAQDKLTASQTVLNNLITAYNNGNCSSVIKAEYTTNYTTYYNIVVANTAALANAQSVYDNLVATLDAAEASQASVEASKKALDTAFYTKYSRYIQEGTWTGESYTNDAAYYYDAMNVLLESSRPSIEYTIEVIDISLLDGYGNYNFQVGDISYIEDTEYFGYTEPDSHGRIVPYREKVIISEIQANLDDPTSNKITIRNYANQFDELFQRVTATVQSYSLNENIYEKANNFTANGELTFDSLQASLINNSLILAQSKNEDVIIDSTGVSLTDLSDNTGMNKVRIVSGGIFVSSDGGQTWTTGITGEGINTNLLLAGQIDAAQINIIDGSYPCFTWDSDGLTAFSYNPNLLNNNNVTFSDSTNTVNKTLHGYSNGDTVIFETINTTTGISTDTVYYIVNSATDTFQVSLTLGGAAIDLVGDGTGYIKTVDYNSYVRFDKDGIHGIQNEVEIFSVDWNGFYLKTSGGAVTISTDNDIQVLNADDNEIIQMGRISGSGTEGDPYEYGIKITPSDGDSEAIFSSNSFAMRALVDNVMTDKIYFDATKGTYIFDGELSADIINALSVLISPNLYAGKATISELTVDQLDTSTKVQNFLKSDTSDVNYVKIYGQIVQWITASLASTYGASRTDNGTWDMAFNTQVATYYSSVSVDDDTGVITYSDGMSSSAWDAYNTGRLYRAIDSSSYYKLTGKSSLAYVYYDVYTVAAISIENYEQVKNRNGELLYWTDSTHESATTDETDYPVYQYLYNESVKQSMTFELNSETGNYEPVMLLGAGTGTTSESGKGKLRKATDGMEMTYTTGDGDNVAGVYFRDDGFVDVTARRANISINTTNKTITISPEGDSQSDIAIDYVEDGDVLTLTWPDGESFTVEVTS